MGKRTIRARGILACRGTAALLSLSLAACGVGAASAPSAASKRVAMAAGASTATASLSTDSVKDLLETLAYAGADVSLPPSNVTVQTVGGRVVITHTIQIASHKDVTSILQQEGRRCMALSVALGGTTVDGSAFDSVTWIAADGAGNVYFAIVDGQGIEFTESGPLDLFPLSDGYLLSDTVYVSISRRLSGIPPRSGVAPRGIDGSEIVAKGVVDVPDELWGIGLPETVDSTDATEYWSDVEVEIESPATWYGEYTGYVTEVDASEMVPTEIWDTSGEAANGGGSEGGEPTDNGGATGGDTGGDAGGEAGGDTGGETGGEAGGGDAGSEAGGEAGGGDAGGGEAPAPDDGTPAETITPGSIEAGA